MHKTLAAAAALGLLALPIQASAQNTNQPAAKSEAAPTQGTATKKAAGANTTKKADANKGTMKRQAHLSKNKRLARGHKLRYAKTVHGKRYVKSHRGQRHAYGFTASKSMHRHHHRHHVAYRGGCR